MIDNARDFSVYDLCRIPSPHIIQNLCHMEMEQWNEGDVMERNYQYEITPRVRQHDHIIGMVLIIWTSPRHFQLYSLHDGERGRYHTVFRPR